MASYSESIVKKYGSGSPVVAVIGSIHGDEPVGSRVIDALTKHPVVKGTLITIIGNPAALKRKKRCLMEDLNRCFPGKKKGTHEEVLAHRIMQIICTADYCIDIHSTTTNTRHAVIVKRKTPGLKKMLSLFSPEHVVFMPKGIGDGSLINFCRAGMSLEYGKHESRSTYIKSLHDTLAILGNLEMIKKGKNKKSKHITQYYEIYGIEPRPQGFHMKSGIKNLTEVKKGAVLGIVGGKKVLAQENFYPFLFGPKSYKDMMGFKAKKIKIF